jgi:hypothetical protein
MVRRRREMSMIGQRREMMMIVRKKRGARTFHLIWKLKN